MNTDARVEAQKQWNARACGELEGDKSSLDYFLDVEKDRFNQQAWTRDYFEYHNFSGQKVLEIGVGQGTDLMQFAKGGAKCHGVDITANHLELTKKNFEIREKTVELKEADATQLPFEDNTFDCIYSFGVMHHIPDIDKVIAEAYRVLKPGGKLMFALYNKYSAFHIFCKILYEGLRHGGFFKKGYAGVLATIEMGADGVNIKPYVKLYSKKSVRKLVSQFNVEDVSVHQLIAEHFWPFWLAKLLGKKSCKKLITKMDSWLGWYVACKATKPK